jgi:cell division protein FtsB
MTMDAELLAFIVVMTLIAVGTWLANKSIRVRQEERRLTASNDGRFQTLTSDNHELKQQVACLEERIAVLERIATDPANRTAREIEGLR